MFGNINICLVHLKLLNRIEHEDLFVAKEDTNRVRIMHFCLLWVFMIYDIEFGDKGLN